MNSKQFLMIGGVILLLLGILGYVLPGGQILPGKWYFTPGENTAHLVIGLVAIVGSYVLENKMQRMVAQLVAVIALFFGVYGFFVTNIPPMNTFGVANLETPYDNILHLFIGVWAAYVGWMNE